MRKIFVYYLLVVLSGLSLAQSREENLEQLNQREDMKVTEIEKDILKIEYPNGGLRIKNIADYKYQSTDKLNYSPTYDSTIIDLTTIDTLPYYQKYFFWQEVLISNRSYPAIGDINGNGRVELYGFEKNYTSDYTCVVAKEMNVSGTFDSVWSYNPSTFARNVYDIDGDGGLDLHLISEESDTVIHWAIVKTKVFTKPDEDSLATHLSFEYQAEDSNTAQYNPRFEKLDGDAYTDYLYLGAPTRQYVGVYEYNPFTNSLEYVMRYNYTVVDTWVEGFAVGDFDGDTKPEFVIGGIHGKVGVFESTGDNDYQLIWQGVVTTNNAYMLCGTNDIDKNGKQELWVGGDAYYNRNAVTRLSCFESNGNNSYQIVARIDLLGVFSFFAYRIKAVDIDNDGTDELMVILDGNFLILKFNGSQGHHTYEVYYIKKNTLENSAYWGATMEDLDYDGNEEILIDMDDDPPQLGNIKFFTSIFKPDSLSNVIKEDYLPENYSLNQNFPNPFNSFTQIKFTIPNVSAVSLIIYDLMGKEIAVLFNQELPSGSYSINWEARNENNSSLPSGVYFIQLTAGSFKKTVKAVLLK